jgi:hypothetical protein
MEPEDLLRIVVTVCEAQGLRYLVTGRMNEASWPDEGMDRSTKRRLERSLASP